jgi:transcriptional regulator with PAS, ATPase and Fis domain
VVVAVGRGELRAVTLAPNTDHVIGRDSDCDVVLDHDRVSRRHARLRITDAGDACTIEDLGSRNGTHVAARLAPATPHVLRTGDTVAIGPFRLVVTREASTQRRSSLVIEDPLAIAESPVLNSVAGASTSVLIRGETGTGKQVLAETLHRLSKRPGRLVSINCAAIGHDLLESELFGHERGAFTGAIAVKPGLLEVAGAGTILLDEIGDMPGALQAKLLHALERREVLRVGGTAPIAIAARFLSATHRDLLAAVEVGDFRLDLYYRLAGITLTIPPLRERGGRILWMARDLLAGAAARDHREAPALSGAAAARLQAHAWPGNVRELRNVLERAMILTETVIDAEHIVFDEAPRKPSATTTPPPEIGDNPEKRAILDALAQCNYNQTRAAKLLGMSRSTFALKLTLHDIPRPRKQ